MAAVEHRSPAREPASPIPVIDVGGGCLAGAPGSLEMVAGGIRATDGTLTFNPGATEKTVALSIIDDTVEDSGETLTLRLSNPTGTQLDRRKRRATGTIGNAEVVAPPAEGLKASFRSVPTAHGGPGEGNRFTFELKFSENPKVSFGTLRAHAFNVTGGTVAPQSVRIETRPRRISAGTSPASPRSGPHRGHGHRALHGPFRRARAQPQSRGTPRDEPARRNGRGRGAHHGVGAESGLRLGPRRPGRLTAAVAATPGAESPLPTGRGRSGGTESASDPQLWPISSCAYAAKRSFMKPVLIMRLQNMSRKNFHSVSPYRHAHVLGSRSQGCSRSTT